MTADEVDRRLADAERLGYTFATRHQPQADLDEPDWIVVVHTPAGRVLFPGAVDSTRALARRRAARVVDRDIAGHPPS